MSGAEEHSGVASTVDTERAVVYRPLTHRRLQQTEHVDLIYQGITL